MCYIIKDFLQILSRFFIKTLLLGTIYALYPNDERNIIKINKVCKS